MQANDLFNRYVLLELLDDYPKVIEAEHTHQGTYRTAVTAENILNRHLNGSLRRYRSGDLSHEQAQQEAKAALTRNRQVILETIQRKFTQPLPSIVETRLTSNDEKRVEDFAKILLDAATQTATELLDRLSALAHQATWQDLNSGLVDTLQVEGFQPLDLVLTWQTSEDDRVCDECNDNSGEYGPEDLVDLPDMPAHAFCRCFWDF